MFVSPVDPIVVEARRTLGDTPCDNYIDFDKKVFFEYILIF